jgi:hypothetical protein
MNNELVTRSNTLSDLWAFILMFIVVVSVMIWQSYEGETVSEGFFIDAKDTIVLETKDGPVYISGPGRYVVEEWINPFKDQPKEPEEKRNLDMFVTL